MLSSSTTGCLAFPLPGEASSGRNSSWLRRQTSPEIHHPHLGGGFHRPAESPLSQQNCPLRLIPSVLVACIWWSSPPRREQRTGRFPLWAGMLGITVIQPIPLPGAESNVDIGPPGGHGRELGSLLPRPLTAQKKSKSFVARFKHAPPSISLSESDREKSIKRFPVTKPKAMKNE